MRPVGEPGRWAGLARAGLVAACLLVACPAGGATAPVAKAGSAPTAGKAADEISLAEPQGKARVGQNSRPASGGLDVWRVLGATGLVVGIIVALRYAAKQTLGLGSAGTVTGAIRVVGRSMLTPRQHLVLIQVGKRLVLVANSGSQVNPLCEISDPDEVASLLAQAPSTPAAVGAGSFLSAFSRAGTAYRGSAEAEADSEAPDVAEEAPQLAATRNELNGLMAKVRALAQRKG